MENGLEAQSEAANFERVLDLDTLVEFSDSSPVLLSEESVIVDTYAWHLMKQRNERLSRVVLHR